METRAEVFDTLAALLRGHGYTARVDPGYRPVIPGLNPQPGKVLALISCAPELVIGMCLGNTAQDPEAHLPNRSMKVAKARQTDPGPPLVAYWCDDEERPDNKE